jgi:hypothetical protein
VTTDGRLTAVVSAGFYCIRCLCPLDVRQPTKQHSLVDLMRATYKNSLVDLSLHNPCFGTFCLV